MKIKITGPVQHDGKTLKVGDTANVSEQVAGELIAAGAAELDGKQKPAAPARGGDQGGQDPADDEQHPGGAGGTTSGEQDAQQ